MQLHASNTRLTLDCGLKRLYGESVAVIIIYFPLLSPCSCGFQANYIQSGLDQLLEVHNEHLLLNLLLQCTSLRKCQIELSLLIIVPGALVYYILTLLVLCIIIWGEGSLVCQATSPDIIDDSDENEGNYTT